MLPKTKIVCTIGPSSSSEVMLEHLITSGMNVARLNFSHGTHDDHLNIMNRIRYLGETLGKPVAILQDLCGPKIRVGQMPESGLMLAAGEDLILTTDVTTGNDGRVSVSYPYLPDEVQPHDRILLADGMMEVEVDRIIGSNIFCKVIIGGILTSHKGLNLITGTLHAPSLTEKDRIDLAFGLENNVDYVALSFVRKPEDILTVRAIMAETGKDVPVIAKIEKHEALECIDEIIRVSDGIMVARGDLGVEIPLENVPHIQKSLIIKARKAGKPVIIATQMLRSMVESPRPTRAEASDVANAVLDGTDAIMLSEETANGDYPSEAVRYMARIAICAEQNFSHDRMLDQMPEKEISESVAHASCVLADHLNVTAIVTPTRSGHTAMQVSKFRPRQRILALCPEMETVRRLCLYWGCLPVYVPDASESDDLVEKATRTALQTGQCASGDLVVITSGYPVWVAGLTNMMSVKRL
ncbi:MAG: pyruvate kinase [Desulfatirhabdiaceae bacterium]